MCNFRQSSFWAILLRIYRKSAQLFGDSQKKKFWPKVLRTAEYEKYFFQQDGARTHTARTVNFPSNMVRGKI